MQHKTLLVIAPNRTRFQYFIEMIDGQQWKNVVYIESAHELFGRSPFTSFVVLLAEYNSHPDWTNIREKLEAMNK